MSAGQVDPPARGSSFEIGIECPHCHEPWLRPSNLPGRYRCVNCLHRYELLSACPDCGSHATIARMSHTSDLQCSSCGAWMLTEI
ncbi:MAG: zinc-ribbon domain-containing protein [Actinobacteria bacterium]|nr:zinc-ribbon domain-containing protein [Actinomycetota bacterium]